MKRLLFLGILTLLLMSSWAGAAETDWKWDLYLIVPKASVNASVITTFAQIYVTGGSGETLANEKKCFDSVVRLSLSGAMPVTHYGLSTPVKPAMLAPFVALLNSLSGCSAVGVAHTDLTNHPIHEVIQSTMAGVTEGQILTWDQTLQYLNTQWGLKVIPNVVP